MFTLYALPHLSQLCSQPDQNLSSLSYVCTQHGASAKSGVIMSNIMYTPILVKYSRKAGDKGFKLHVLQ